jgi:hypothetical protein
MAFEGGPAGLSATAVPWCGRRGTVIVGVVSTAAPPPAQHGIDVTAFGRLPVLEGGRIKPLDSVARNGLSISDDSAALDDPNQDPMRRGSRIRLYTRGP